MSPKQGTRPKRTDCKNVLTMLGFIAPPKQWCPLGTGGGKDLPLTHIEPTQIPLSRGLINFMKIPTSPVAWTGIPPLVVCLLLLPALALAQTPAATPDPKPAPIDYATVQVVSAADSSAVVAEKAAKVLPRANQSAWMRL